MTQSRNLASRNLRQGSTPNHGILFARLKDGEFGLLLLSLLQYLLVIERREINKVTTVLVSLEILLALTSYR